MCSQLACWLSHWLSCIENMFLQKAFVESSLLLGSWSFEALPLRLVDCLCSIKLGYVSPVFSLAHSPWLLSDAIVVGGK